MHIRENYYRQLNGKMYSMLNIKTAKSLSSARDFELSTKLLALDDSIISATIASPIGEVLSMKYAPPAEHLKPTEELLDKAGALIAMTTALIRQVEDLYGGTRYIKISFGKMNVMIIPVKRKRIIIALGTLTNAPLEEIYRNLSRLVE